MKKHIITYILVLFCLILYHQSSVAQQNIEKQKAIWIVNSFMPNCTWPKESSIKEFKIGLLAPSNELFNQIRQLAKSNRIKGKTFTVTQFKDVANVEFAHALYIGKSFNSEIKRITEKADKHTLIITDRLEKSDDYMINFLDLATKQKKYEINIENIREHGLAISRKIYIHGGKTEDLKKLFNKLKKELAQERQKYAKVNKELDKMIANVNAIKEENKNARLQNEKQKEINDKKRRELRKIKKEIDEKEANLFKIKNEIEKQSEVLNINKQILDKKYRQIETSKKEIQKRRDKIEEQNALIKKKKTEIENKDVQLLEQEYLLNLQKIVLAIFITLLVTAVIMVIIIWRVYVSKQKINKKLKLTNEKINSQKEEISQQHKYTDMLNKELERLSLVAAQTENAVTIMDTEGNFEWLNVGFTKIYGYTLQLLVNELDRNLMGVSGNPDIKNIFDRCIETKTTQIYESENITRTGEHVWVQTSLTPILDQEGNVVKLITVETDVTNIKETENKIRTQHRKVLEQTRELELSNSNLERLSLVARKTENAIAIMNEVGDYQWINEGYSRLYGYSFHELTREYSKNIITRDTQSHIIKLIKKSIEEKVSVKFHRVEKHADGHKIYVQTTLSPIITPRNTISNLISVSTDISKLKETEQSILQKNEELIEQQTEIVVQKNIIDSKNQNINASITYAKTIQNAILPPDNFLNRIFETFVIYQPLELVSGDFYWSSVLKSNHNESPIVLFAVADCTGHGVPGAFMSMIGSSMLDEIVNERKIITPSLILKNMNKEIQSMLRQESAINNDSMDVCLCSLEKLEGTEKVKIVFAGAKRPLYYFSKAQNQVMRVKGTRKTIGGIKAIRNKEEFVDHTIILDKGDYIYLSTDGIVDQPSANLEKFGSKRFTNMLEQISDEDLDTQKRIIEQKLAEHMGTAQRRDDICFMAVKI